jgi:probable phosphoglycerate mutase
MTVADQPVERVTTRVILVRHGESNATVERRLAGSATCSGLSPLGVAQSERLRDRFASGYERPIDLLVTSPLPRAAETAAVLAPVLGLEPRVDPAWEEHRPGVADGMAFDEVVARYGPPPVEHDLDHRWWPEAETLGELRQRVLGALDRVLVEGAGRTTLVTCHGGVIDVVFRHLLGLPPVAPLDLWTINTSLTEFACLRPAGGTVGRWRLVRYNDAAHLAGLPADSRRPRAAPVEAVVDAD